MLPFSSWLPVVPETGHESPAEPQILSVPEWGKPGAQLLRILNLQPDNLKGRTLNSIDPKPQTPNPKPETLNSIDPPWQSVPKP